MNLLVNWFSLSPEQHVSSASLEALLVQATSPAIFTPMAQGNYLAASADFSHDYRYRYALTRRLGLGERIVLFVGLNPSTATAEQDDPTIRRCVGFARRWGYDWYYMGNIMAFRSTDPRGLPADSAEAVGPENRDALEAMAEQADLIVAAWGSNRLGPEAQAIADWILSLPKTHCLGVNKNGSPKHPLYLRQDTTLCRVASPVLVQAARPLHLR